MSEWTRRVVILLDTQSHMMPALALEMARRDHDLVLGDAKDGLADELVALGAKVEVVPDTADQTEPDTIRKLVDRATEAFGGFDSACIRSGVHGGGDILTATAEDLDIQYAGNIRWSSTPALGRCGHSVPEHVDRASSSRPFQMGDPVAIHDDGTVEVG